MLRMLLWGMLWIASLGFLDIRVKYSDGLTIRYKGWFNDPNR